MKFVRHTEFWRLAWDDTNCDTISKDLSAMIAEAERKYKFELTGLSISDIPGLRGLVLEFRNSEDCSKHSVVNFIPINSSDDVMDKINSTIKVMENSLFEYVSMLPSNYSGMCGIFLVFRKV